MFLLGVKRVPCGKLLTRFVCVDHLLLSQVTYNNKEDSAMIHRLYGCTAFRVYGSGCDYCNNFISLREKG